MWRGRGRQPQTLGGPQPGHRSESRRLSYRRRPVKTTVRQRDRCPGALHEGDVIHVFSRSAGEWVNGEVAKVVENDFVRVEYKVGDYLCSKTMHRHSKHLGIHPYVMEFIWTHAGADLWATSKGVIKALSHELNASPCEFEYDFYCGDVKPGDSVTPSRLSDFWYFGPSQGDSDDDSCQGDYCWEASEGVQRMKKILRMLPDQEESRSMLETLVDYLLKIYRHRLAFDCEIVRDHRDVLEWLLEHSLLERRPLELDEDSLDWYLRHGPSDSNSVRDVPDGYEILPIHSSPFSESVWYSEHVSSCNGPGEWRTEQCGWSGGDLLRHRATGVILLGRALSVQNWCTSDDYFVLYHYCPEDAFTAIAKSEDFRASTSLTTDCDFGVGVYATKKQPHMFDTIVDILYNNYPRATSNGPGHPDFPKECRASHCIPLLVDSKWTPALPLSDPDGQRGAICERHDRYGPFDANRHDIWIVDASKAEKNDVVRGTKQQTVLALLKAVQQGQTDVVKSLLPRCENVDVVNHTGNGTLLHIASRMNQVDIVRELISARACVNLADRDGCTALILSSNAVAIRELLSAGADVNAVSLCGQTALHWCCQEQNHAEIRELLTARADVNHADCNGMTALLWVARPVDYEDASSDESSWEPNVKGLICELISARADVNHANSDGKTALLTAVQNTRCDPRGVLRYDPYDDDGPYLIWGSYEKQTAVVRELLSAGASISSSDAKGRTALQLACRGHVVWEDYWTEGYLHFRGPNIHVIHELLSARADVNRADSQGETALLWATEEEWEEAWGENPQTAVIRKLLSARAAINLAHFNRMTALRLAMSPRVIDLVRERLSTRDDAGLCLCIA